SVIADTTLEADALSTAMMVMGPDAADALARKHGIAAHFILKSGKALEEQWTPAFEAYVSA
ncbi:MAG: FAD:protein FMN transferase ApbE, partial [Gammaproteobacteria bacterium]